MAAAGGSKTLRTMRMMMEAFKTSQGVDAILKPVSERFMFYAARTLLRTPLSTQCHVVDGKPGLIVVGGFKVRDEHTNLMGSMHGGVAATLLDIVTTMSLMKEDPTETKFGVSVDLNLS